MKICGDRLKLLRESMNYSQMKTATIFGVGQSSIARYEKAEASPPLELLVRIADHYNVSLDYILGRTDNPQGKLYNCMVPVDQSSDMMDFIEMCFDPQSPMNARLKQTLIQMLQEEVDAKSTQ